MKVSLYQVFSWLRVYVMLLEFQKQIHTIKSEETVYVMLILSNYSGAASLVTFHFVTTMHHACTQYLFMQHVYIMLLLLY